MQYIRVLCTRPENLIKFPVLKSYTFKDKKLKGVVREIPRDFYLQVVVSSEMKSGWHPTAYKCGAIAANTYLQRKIDQKIHPDFDITDLSQYHQAYDESDLREECKAPVSSVFDLILTYDDEPIKAYYYASNDGWTKALSEPRWSGRDVDYLIRERDLYGKSDEGKSNGHGYGMSQWGAQHRALRGHSMESILNFYYRGAILKNLEYKEDIVATKRDIRISLDDGHADTLRHKKTPAIPDDIYIDEKLVRKKGQYITENEFNDAVCDELEIMLVANGFEVYRPSPDKESDPSISERQKKIRENDCDFSISIHYNAAGSSSEGMSGGDGLSGFVHADYGSQISKKYVDIVLDKLSKIKNQRVRGGGYREEHLGMCNERWIGCPAVLIEHGFMTSRKEHKWMVDPYFVKACAKAHLESIFEIFDIDDNIVIDDVVVVKENPSDSNNSSIKSYTINAPDGSIYMRNDKGKLIKKYRNGSVMILLEQQIDKIKVMSEDDGSVGYFYNAYINKGYLIPREYKKEEPSEPVEPPQNPSDPSEGDSTQEPVEGDTTAPESSESMFKIEIQLDNTTKEKSEVLLNKIKELIPENVKAILWKQQ